MPYNTINYLNHTEIFEKLIGNISDSVIITKGEIEGPHGPEIIYVNEAFKSMTGYTEEDAIGNTPRMLQGPATSREELDKIYFALQKFEKVSVELINYNKNREEFIIEMEIIPVTIQDGSKFFIAIQRDITERKEKEDYLHKSNVLNQQLFESSPDCLKMIDKDGRLKHMNLNGCKLMEIDDFSQFQFQIWSNLWPEHLRHIVNESVESANKGANYHFQAECPTAKGTLKWWDVLVTPVFNKDNQVEMIISSSRDITKLKEEENRKIEFLKLVSHELKTPLTSIKGYTQLLMDNSIEDNVVGEMSQYALGRIDSQVNRLNKLIGELLDISRVDNAAMQLSLSTFNMRDIMIRTIDDLRRSYPKRNIILNMDKDIVVHADEDKIGQVIINLVTNALKYSSVDTDVIVTMKDLLDRISVQVEDFGMGISESDVNKLFQKFYQVDKSKHNTGFGIGLYLCHEIIKLHKGTVTVKSKLGEGSTFAFIIPK